MREVTAKEREAYARDREANARMIEAQAISEKAKKETAILAIDETVKILKARKELLDGGICTMEMIDQYLPLPKKSNNSDN